MATTTHLNPRGRISRSGGCQGQRFHEAASRVRRLVSCRGVPREVLPALVHLLPRSGDAAVHGRIAKKSLTPQAAEVKIGKLSYRADISGSTGWVRERGPGGEKKYRIEQALGGKNVYDFLTPLEKGRLQTLPVAYDVQKKEWFDTAASGIRHFPGGQAGQQVDWKDPAYTFNTSCYGCHVSQLSTNYDLKTDTYKTTWAEPGINCEACHGPSAEHNPCLPGNPQRDKSPKTSRSSVGRTSPPSKKRRMLDLSREDVPDHFHLCAWRSVFRPLRSRDPGGPGLLPRRPRPGGELHLHLMDVESMREGREAPLRHLPHIERPLPVQEPRKRPTMPVCPVTKTM